MKFKKIMIVAFVLLAILTIGAASAADDVASDDLAVEDIDEVSVDTSQDDLAEDSGDVLASSEEETVGDGEYNITFYEDNEYDQYDEDDEETHVVDIRAPEEAEFYVIGTVEGIDDNVVDCEFDDLNGENGFYYLIPYDFDLDAGTYNITISCYDLDDNLLASQTGTLKFIGNEDDDDDEGNEFEATLYDDEPMLFYWDSVLEVYCPEESTGTVTVTVKDENGEIIYTSNKNVDDADEEGKLYWTLAELNITSVGEYTLEVSNDGEEIDDLKMEAFAPFLIGDNTVINSTDKGLLVSVFLPKSIENATIIVSIEDKSFSFSLNDFVYVEDDNDGSKPIWFNPSFGPEPDMNQKSYQISNSNLKFDFEEKTYEVYVKLMIEGMDEIIDSKYVEFISRNVIGNDNVTIEIFKGEYAFDFGDDVVKIAKEDDCEGYILITVADNAWNKTIDLSEIFGAVYLCVDDFADLGKGEFEITVAYYDENDEMVFNVTDTVSFYYSDDDADDGVVFHVLNGDEKEFDLNNQDDLNTPFAYVSVRNDIDGRIIIIIWDEEGDEQELCSFNLDDITNTNTDYLEGFTVYMIALNDLEDYNDFIECGGFKLAFRDVMNDEVDSRSYDIDFDDEKNIVSFWESDDDDEDYEQYIFMTTDNVNPHFDVNTGENVTGKVIVKCGENIIKEIDLDEIAEYDDYDGRWHHDVWVNWNDLDEGNYNITITYNDENGNVMDSRDFDIVIEEEDYEQYIFMTTDNVNPHFDVNTGENVTGKVIVKCGENIIKEINLEEIAEYDDNDERWHHDVWVNWNNLDEGNYNITITYNDENGNVMDSRDFDIVIENWNRDPPEIFIMWSNYPDGDKVEYSLDSTDMVHIYPKDDNSDLANIRIIVKIGDETYLNATLAELNLEAKINNFDETYYTVGPVHFTKEITPGHYDNVIAYYDSDNYHVTSADGDMPDYANLFGISSVTFSNDIEYTHGDSGTTTMTLIGATVSEGDISVDGCPEAQIALEGDVITVSGLDVGNYTLKVVTTPVNEYYRSVEAYANIKVKAVIPVDPELSIASVGDVEEGSDVVISISTLANFTGSVKVSVGGVEVGTADVSAGSGNFTVPTDKLAVGENTVFITSEASEHFTASEANVTFNVIEKVVPPAPVSPELSIAPVDDVEEGIDVVISISALGNFTGSVKVLVGDVEVGSADVAAGAGTFTIAAGNFTVGANTVKVVSDASENFTAGEANVTFNVIEKVVPPAPVSPELSIAPVDDVEEGIDVVITISALGNFTGCVKVLVGDVEVGSADVAAGAGTFTIAAGNFTVGVNTVKVVSDASENFTAGEANVTFNVIEKVVPLVPTPVDPELAIAPVSDVEEGTNVTISISAVANFTGCVKVLVGDVEVGTADVAAGAGTFTIAAGNFTVGVNTVKVVSDASENFTAGEANATFNVTEKVVPPVPTPVDPALTISVDDIREGTDAVVAITTNSTFSGDVAVQIGGANYTVAVVNGTGSLPVSGLAVGNYTAVATFEATDVFSASTKNATFKVNKEVIPDPDTAISTDSSSTSPYPTYSINLGPDATGTFSVKIGDKVYKKELKDGVATIEVTDLPAGAYEAVISYSGDAKYAPISKTVNSTVKVATTIKAAAVTTTYGTSKNIVITLTDANGKVLANKKVTVVLNGAKKELTTNAKGQVSYAIGTKLAVKKYDATFTFDGDANYVKSTGTAKVTVNKAKPILTAKKKTFKAKKKSKKYTVTLKTNKGKAMKNAKVTLTGKFKGKKIKITKKTNSKGKATFNLKKLTKKGKFTAKIKFKGNKSYKAVTKKAKITVK